MPAKEAIREIRINQNPFAAENDQPSGGINILTRPGTDKFRGSASLNFNDESLNSRNPFQINSSKRSPFQVRQFGGDSITMKSAARTPDQFGGTAHYARAGNFF